MVASLPRLPFSLVPDDVPGTSPSSSPATPSTSVSDSKAPFLHLPWASRLLSQPNTTILIPGSRHLKPTIPGDEDSLFAETLKTPRALRSCICIHPTPAPTASKIEQISVLALFGPGVNGHRHIIHGGITAALIDETMGILQSANHMREFLLRRERGEVKGEMPGEGMGTFTVKLEVEYKAPVRTPGAVLVSARYERREGRKEWIAAEVRQWGEDGEGEGTVCAVGKALFVEPRGKL